MYTYTYRYSTFYTFFFSFYTHFGFPKYIEQKREPKLQGFTINTTLCLLNIKKANLTLSVSELHQVSSI